MTSGDSFVWRPIVASHFAIYPAVMAGEIDLAAIAEMNEALDVQAENENRHYLAAKKGA